MKLEIKGQYLNSLPIFIICDSINLHGGIFYFKDDIGMQKKVNIFEINILSIKVREE